MNALQTSRLTLRPFSRDDLDDLSALMANADFMRFSLGVFSREQTAIFLEKVRSRDRAGLPSQFAVVLRESERLIGFCGFFVQTVDGVEELEIAYRLDPSCWGQGIGTEAARAVRDHAFAELELSRVISLIHPENIAVPPRRGKKWNAPREGDSLSRLSDDRFRDQSRTQRWRFKGIRYDAGWLGIPST